MQNYANFDATHFSQRRVCRSCEAIYTIRDSWEQNPGMFEKPTDYRAGCEEYCLACWLCVGPLDVPTEIVEPNVPDLEVAADDQANLREPRCNVPNSEFEDDGDLLARFGPFLDEGYLLAVMPISRVFVEWFPITYRNCFTFFPPSFANIDQLKVIPNREVDCPLAEGQSAASGFTEELLNELPLVAFPCRGDMDNVLKTNHHGHLDLIRQLSESVDRACLDFVRYRLCGFEPVDTLPGRAGQMESNPMMAGLCLYDPLTKRSRIFGGAAFTHTITRGLGLVLESVHIDEFPRLGEVGHIVEHALSLYVSAIEAVTATSRFVQAVSLLEFLAYPSDVSRHHNFEEVKKVISRYVAKTPEQWYSLLERFKELTGLKDEKTGRLIGYRTRIVHKGEQLEGILPDLQQRLDLFQELDGYIRAVIDHMISHSELTFEEYEIERGKLRPFEA